MTAYQHKSEHTVKGQSDDKFKQANMRQLNAKDVIMRVCRLDKSHYITKEDERRGQRVRAPLSSYMYLEGAIYTLHR